MKVTVDEITQTLVSCGASQLASAIREHGIAPPNGYVLVPVEPTLSMRQAGNDAFPEAPLSITCGELSAIIYKAMLASVPKDEQ